MLHNRLPRPGLWDPHFMTNGGTRSRRGQLNSKLDAKRSTPHDSYRVQLHLNFCLVAPAHGESKDEEEKQERRSR